MIYLIGAAWFSSTHRLQGRKGGCHPWTSDGPQAHIRIPLGIWMHQPAVLRGEQAVHIKNDNDLRDGSQLYCYLLVAHTLF